MQFFLTQEIVTRKFPKLASDLARRVKTGHYSYGFSDFLGTVRNELYDLDLDECFYAFKTRPAKMSVEESDAYEICLQTNKVVFGSLVPARDCKALAMLAFYAVDQGLRAKIAREIFVANTTDSDEDIAEKIETRFKEE